MILFVVIMAVVAVVASYAIFHVITWFISRDFFGTNQYYDDDCQYRYRRDSRYRDYDDFDF